MPSQVAFTCDRRYYVTSIALHFWMQLTVLVFIMYTVYTAVWEDLKVKPDAHVAVQPPHSLDTKQIVSDHRHIYPNPIS